MCDNRIGVNFEWLKHLEIDDWLYDLSKISLNFQTFHFERPLASNLLSTLKQAAVKWSIESAFRTVFEITESYRFPLITS